MRLSLRWLNEILGTKISLEEVKDRLSQAGLPVETARRLDADCAEVIVGEVIKVSPHPQADRLRVTIVRTGPEERHTIVCGAPNVAVGQKVAVALPGMRLAQGRQINRATIRGVASDGMICAEDELGLGSGHEGIMVLPPEATVGAKLVRVLGLDDTVLDIEVTPNRADCMSVAGVARDLAVLSGRSFRSFVPSRPVRGTISVKVRVQDRKACPFYAARLVTGIIRRETPAWMRGRLIAAGMRSVNLIVDTTNYVMLELGQPMHAFDADKISHLAIVVRRARKGEQLRTLDNIERSLDKDALIIADSRGPIALAGVMGGAATEVGLDTQDVILEAAVFNPRVVRRTARSRHLLSEASQRFERGVDPDMTALALDRAAELLDNLGGGVLAGRPTVVKAPVARRRPINLKLPELATTLNITLPVSRIRRIFTRLGCRVSGSAKVLRIVPPTWRQDINIPEDLVEELARVYGYHKLTPTRLSASLRPIKPTAEENIETQAREALVALGYAEVYSYAFGPSSGDQAEAAAWRVANPLDPKQAVLRQTLVHNLNQIVRSNLEREPLSQSLAFEIGTVFLRRPSLRRPDEERVVSATSWRTGGHSPWPGSRAKSHLAFFCRQVGLPAPTYVRGQIIINGQSVGRWGVGEETIMGRHLYHREGWELSLTKVVRLVEPRAFQPFSNFPPVKRDLSLWVPRELEAAKLYAVMQSASPLLQRVDPFDLFEKEGRVSAAFHLIFQSSDHTLASAEVEAAVQAIIKQLSEKLSITIRT